MQADSSFNLHFEISVFLQKAHMATKDKSHITYSDWEPWFAWHPVTTVSNNRIWLKTVYRRYRMIFGIEDDMGYYYGDEFDVLKTT